MSGDVVQNFISSVGTLATVVQIAMFIILVLICCRYLISVAKRFGLGLWKRQIAIITSDTNLVNSLKADLTSTGFIRAGNVVHISIENLKDLPGYSIAVIDYGSFLGDKGQLCNFIEQMDSSVGIVLYCRPEHGRLSDELMQKINNSSRVILTNFRGRLVNDVISSLVSTPYEKK